MLTKLTELSPKDANAWYGLGVIAQSMRRLDTAIRSYKKAVALDPRNANAYFNLGIANQNRGFSDEALQALRRGAVLSPSVAPDAYNNIGIILRNERRYDEAIVAHKQAIALNDSAVLYYAALGHTYLDGQKYAEGKTMLESALTKHVDQPELLFALGLIYMRLGEPQKTEQIITKLDTQQSPLAAELRTVLKN